MKIFAVLLPMRDEEKSNVYRPQHLDYLAKLREEGKILANGRFTDGAGGLVIYRADSYDTVKAYVENDPYVVHGARTYHIHEWEMVTGRGPLQN
ncbi:YciI family protein [Novibacillus thermophilus]|jgi:uncharacterized protein YciI|uniref:YCII-related domain-containing protein n=1 Tax=Novibacillus thermophilus TaxID=1471761 RepID=A0A1U9K4E4_9BACL|nr:YciI family protein [Novibacillus thermophilus]AQS54894.1 hypothetical protein B0W44_03010 [Novibacillus thermophilus]